MALRWILALMLALAALPARADMLNVRTGELTITHVADLPAGRMFELGGKPAALGWLHREYSLFDAPFHVFDERGWVLYRAEGLRRDYVALTPDRLTELERAAGADWSRHPPLGFLERHGGTAGLLLLVAALVASAARRTAPRPPGPGRSHPPALRRPA